MRYRFLRFPEGRPKALTLSYDDGCTQDIRLADILSRYGIKCTFNLNSERLGRKGDVLNINGKIVNHAKVNSEDVKHIYDGH